MTRPGIVAGVAGLGVAVAIAATALLMGQDDPAPEGWSPPAAASSLLSEGGDTAIAGDGTVLAAWTEERLGESAVMFSERPPGGDWSAPTAIQPPQRWPVTGPAIAADDHGGAVVTFGLRSRQASLVLGSVRPRGGAWEAPRALTRVVQGPFEAAAPAIDATGGLVLAWTASGPGVLASLRPPGEPWRDPDRVGRSTGPLPSPPEAAIAPDGTAVVATAGRVVIRPPGGTWSALPPLPGRGPLDAAFAATPVVVDASGRPTVVWTRPEGARAETLVWSRFAGGVWEVPRVLDRAARGRPLTAVRAVRSGAGVAVAWARWATPCARVAVRAALPTATGAPGRPATLDAFATPDPCGRSTGPVSPPAEIRMAGGDRPVALWTRRVDLELGRSDLVVSAVGAGGAWSRPERVTPAPVTGWPLSVGRDGEHPVASWAEYRTTGEGGTRLLASERLGGPIG